MEEAEEATARGELVRSARRFVEELERSRTPYKRKVELLEMQVRLAKEQKDHLWLKSAAQTADRCGFKSRQWICDNIYDIGSRRDRPTSMRTQQINETLGPRLSATSASEKILHFSCGCQTPGRTSLPQSHRRRRSGCWLRVRRFPFMQRGMLSRTPPHSHQQRKKPSSPEDKGARPKEFPTHDARSDRGKKSRVAQPKVHSSTYRLE